MTQERTCTGCGQTKRLGRFARWCKRCLVCAPDGLDSLTPEAEIVADENALTERQVEILDLRRQGKGNEVIGNELGILPGTVAATLSNMRKAGVDVPYQNGTSGKVAA